MTKTIGWSLIATGVLANPIVLGALLSEDGRVESILFNGLILLVELLAIGAGIYLVREGRPAALVNVSLAFISLLVALLLAEVGARLVLFGSAAFSPRMMASVSDLRLRDLVREVDDPNLGYMLKPNLDLIFKLTPLRTNDVGLHDRSYEKVKPPNTFRIVVIGDSFTMPAGVALEKAWHSRLEQALNATAGGREFEVINFGVAGYDLRQYVAILRSVAKEYDPDLVLLGFCAENDHQRGLDPAGLTATSPVPRRLPQSYLFRLLSQLNYASHTEHSKAPTPEESDYVETQFRELAAVVDVPLVVAYLANLPRDGADAIGDLAEAAGFGFVDVSAAFADKPLASYAIFHPIDSHPNAAANAIFAEEVLAYLDANAGVYLGGVRGH